jgi:hypothetical protein
LLLGHHQMAASRPARDQFTAISNQPVSESQRLAPARGTR